MGLMSHAIAALSGDPQATRIYPSYLKGRDLGLIMALILKKSSMPIEVLDASTSIGQQLVNRPNSVWDWVYVMPPFPFFCDSLTMPHDHRYRVWIQIPLEPKEHLTSHPRYRQGVHRSSQQRIIFYPRIITLLGW